MLIKVCGMRDDDNIRALRKLNPDFIGLIFYSKSSRFVGDKPTAALKESFGLSLKVGVFVNSETNYIQQKILDFGLDMVQLHGGESPEFCTTIGRMGVKVIKSFSIATEEDLQQVCRYEGKADFFLFDTKTAGFGGSGRKFEWEILRNYHCDTPFLLSGGIDEADIEAVRQIRLPRMAGIDLNSKFEVSPALKDIDKLNRTFAKLRAQTDITSKQ